MRKVLSFSLIICLLLALCCACQKESSMTIGIVPLDSRPCNTQYPTQLAQMAAWEVCLPPNDLLDDFTTPSDSGGLWQWLEESDCDKYILFTNQLLNGGLIHSRSLTSFRETDAFLANLALFIESHKESDITVVTVLPRLLPSQYDAHLWQYKDELSAYGSALDQAIESNGPVPLYPQNVPANLVEEYLALYECNRSLLNELCAFASDNVTVLIGQDDAQQYCPSNIIYREFAQKSSENIRLLRGADELTMLTVASFNDTPTSLNIIYTNPTYATYYYPYEAAELRAIIEEKAAFLNIALDSAAKDTLIVHTDGDSLVQTQSLLQRPYEGYLGLADIAYTNKGDLALSDTLLDRDTFQKVHCYSGWNTASNTIGTVLAHYCMSNIYADSDEAGASALAFKLTRYSEDLVYMGAISNHLRAQLLAEGKMDATTEFSDENVHLYANELLNGQFAPYGAQLKNLALGEQEILPDYTLSVSDAQYAVDFPWCRAFEIYAQWHLVLP